MKKKGQLMAQPLIYAFALIVGALVLTWGISTIIKLKDTAAQTEIGTFASKVESEVQQYLNYDEGSTTTIKITLPEKIKYLCFYDSTKEKDCTTEGKKCDIAKLDEGFAALANTNTQYNMFYLPLDAYKNQLPPKRLENLQVDTTTGNPICFMNKPGNKLTLTSMGTYVSAS